ncbi:hypothetical protein EEW87_17110 [Janibacter melonis]|uniref:Integral membrane protein n=1 Tax=Janibacter melonis TaxID=262209 RepID=A0A650GFM1_9MICO|nr:hypothetical protein EEW87_17110 [Janibacter melonis]
MPAAAARARARRWAHVDPARRGLVLAWVGFTLTFALARLVTGVIKIGDQDTGDVVVGGVHLHHYLWGIAIVVAVAIYGLVDRSARTRSVMGAALGVGVALIVDEIALLVTLEDVYWTSEGWSSVAVAVIIIGVVGSALAATRSGRQDD